ncbi:MAG: 30S ribosomal protein S4 [Chthoniobacterales bacterium]|nr:30S ribosomal protein S4 [Chthoniobacterales bacterium]MCX7713567.1 30S ribosomal protein S4 [Chthoniobacterales bacterium]
MARYTGPKTKISRRFGIYLGGSQKAFERRNFPPGMHGTKGARRKQTDFAVALAEKQKLRHIYGLMERQFRRYFNMALRRKGVTGEMLLQFLETRLDNIVFRMGFAKTLRAARQMVSHGHILVNGHKANIPSMNLKPGDRVEIKDNPRSKSLAMRGLELTQIVPVPDWLSLDRDKLTGTVVRTPSREEINVPVNEQLVVEFYSR